MALPGGPKIRGSVIKAVRAWIKTAYGDAVVQAGLSALDDEEKTLLVGSILPSRTYPVVTWDKFLAAVRVMVKDKFGESESTFDMRNMREGGRGMVQSLFAFALGLISPTSVVSKVPAVYNRIYSEGHCEVIENASGRAVVRFADADPMMLESLTHHFPPGIALLLEMNGVKEVEAAVSKSGVIAGRLFVDATVTYKA